jgi:hypothetical protein
LDPGWGCSSLSIPPASRSDCKDHKGRRSLLWKAAVPPPCFAGRISCFWHRKAEDRAASSGIRGVLAADFLHFGLLLFYFFAFYTLSWFSISFPNLLWHVTFVIAFIIWVFLHSFIQHSW